MAVRPGAFVRPEAPVGVADCLKIWRRVARQRAFTGTYDVEGNLLTEGYPNGMTAKYTYVVNYYAGPAGTPAWTVNRSGEEGEEEWEEWWEEEGEYEYASYQHGAKPESEKFYEWSDAKECFVDQDECVHAAEDVAAAG